MHGILRGVDPVSGVVNPQQIAVLGLGYVGCVTAACLAHLGHRVVGVDRDQFKVDAVRAMGAEVVLAGATLVVLTGVDPVQVVEYSKYGESGDRQSMRTVRLPAARCFAD